MMEGNTIGYVSFSIICICFFGGIICMTIDMIICKDFHGTPASVKKKENKEQEPSVDHPTYYFRKKEVPELLLVADDFFDDEEIEY